MGTHLVSDPAYPVAYSADFVQERSRLTTFFRIVLLIPAALVAFVYGIGAIFTVIGAWFALVITGRYPAGLYAYNAGLVRFGMRLNAYASLVTDAYPPLGLFAEAPDHPVRIEIGPPKASYSRAKAFFRLILAIPPYLVMYVLQVVGQFVAIGSWFFIVITGRQLPALQAIQNMNFGFGTRTYAYMLLLTEDWPPFGEIQPQLAPGGRAPEGLEGSF